MAAITVSNLESVPEHLRPEYEPQADGSFRQKGTEGWESADQVKGLKSALGGERLNFRALARVVSRVHGVSLRERGDLMQRLRTIPEDDDAGLGAFVTEVLGGDTATLRAENESLRASARDNAARVAIQDNKGNPALLLPYLTAHAKYGADGKVTVAGKEYADVAAAVKALRDVPELAGAWAGTGNSGGGPGGGSSKGGGGDTKPQPKRSRMSQSERAKFIAEHGGAAYLALPT